MKQHAKPAWTRTNLSRVVELYILRVMLFRGASSRRVLGDRGRRGARSNSAAHELPYGVASSGQERQGVARGLFRAASWRLGVSIDMGS